jgi:hypothetical protein
VTRTLVVDVRPEHRDDLVARKPGRAGKDGQSARLRERARRHASIAAHRKATQRLEPKHLRPPFRSRGLWNSQYSGCESVASAMV